MIHMIDQNLTAIFLLFISSTILYFLLPENSNDDFKNDFINYDFSNFNMGNDQILEIFSSTNENEIINYRIILDANNIKYCILNSVFHHLYPGPYIWGYNVSRFFVNETDYDLAYSLLSHYQAYVNELNTKTGSSAKTRNIIEVLLLGWIIHDKAFRGNTCLAKHKNKA